MILLTWAVPGIGQRTQEIFRNMFGQAEARGTPLNPQDLA